MNVYLRDTQHLVEVILMAWFWAIPGIYPYSGRVQHGLVKHTIFGIPGTHLIWLYFANPVSPVVMSFQRVFYNVDPSPIDIGLTSTTRLHHERRPGQVRTPLVRGCRISPSLGCRLVLLLGAMVVFGRLEGNFAEEL